MNVVVFLVLILFVGSIIFFNTLDAKNKNIQAQQETIEYQTTENSKLSKEKKDIYDKQVALQNLNHSLIKEHDMLGEKFDLLQGEYDNLKSKYNLLESTLNTKQRKIDELQASNNNLEIRCSNYSRTLSRKDNDYSALQKKFNSLNYSYEVLSNKYYSTKEGKKELKKNK